ncbi:MAG: glycosyltransferase family 2 protein [Bacteroidetes bacterium]|nr:glycosyltransferase family 2 protein [Bacteroidota bacterium]
MVSVIIINYNTFQLTVDCIKSVLSHTKATPIEIILVDNASTEKDPHEFSILFPTIKLVCSERNLGFAGGNNLGIQIAKGDFILLLNSDTYLMEDSISLSVAAMLQHTQVGVLGCRQIFPDGIVQFSARRFRTISWELFDLFRFLLYLLPPTTRSVKMLGQYFKHDRSIEVDWVNGAFFMIRRSALTQLPNQQLDNLFFMYGEDVLWCEQFKALGFSVYFLASTTIVHIAGASTAIQHQLRLRRVMMQNELLIMQRRKGKGFYYYCFACLFTAKEYFRLVIKWIVFKTTGKLIR